MLDGKLYVVGGSDQQMSVLSAECLDLTLPEDQVTRVDNITMYQYNYTPVELAAAGPAALLAQR